jgi:aldose 1-epimerase
VNASPSPGRLIRLCVGDAVALVAPDAGGRLQSLGIAGHELLVTAGPEPFGWGAFPMVPYAGRIRGGALSFRGRTHRLPVTLPPHAIHGTLADVPWDVAEEPGAATLTLTADLHEPWPFRGRVTQRYHLEAGALRITLGLDAAEPMPASMGWHPWFRRQVEGASGGLALEIDPAWVFVRDADYIATPELVRPGPHPWDDCFTGVRRAPRLSWPGLLDLRIESDCRYWVVYDMPSDAICVEPQTAPPDGLNWLPPEDVLVEPGRPLVATMTMRWRMAGGRP